MKRMANIFKSWQEEQGNEELTAFLQEWFNDQSYVIGHTSGSTGKPKEMQLSKEDMRASARLTNEYFGICEESVLLLCLSVSYIAGKMMVVRALEAGADLIIADVSSRPLRNIEHREIDLVAMVPMQVEETLKHPKEQATLAEIKHLLIGGASVSPHLERGLKGLPTVSYATYGMTETVSHIALRRLNCDPCYLALGKVCFSTDERDCLVIEAPHLKEKIFVTNDMVELVNQYSFKWLGRYDQVINSGGLKFFPELIERKIAINISRRYFISSQADERLGERIVLVIEGNPLAPRALDQLQKKLKALLSDYEQPKAILFLPHFHETSSGKVIRLL